MYTNRVTCMIYYLIETDHYVISHLKLRKACSNKKIRVNMFTPTRLFSFDHFHLFPFVYLSINIISREHNKSRWFSKLSIIFQAKQKNIK